MKDIREHPFWGIQVIGLLSGDVQVVGKTVEGVKIIGEIAGMQYLAEDTGASELVIPMSEEEKEEELPTAHQAFVESWIKTGKIIRVISEASQKPLSGARMKMGKEVLEERPMTKGNLFEFDRCRTL